MRKARLWMVSIFDIKFLQEVETNGKEKLAICI